jgi:hypothetical protein
MKRSLNFYDNGSERGQFVQYQRLSSASVVPVTSRESDNFNLPNQVCQAIPKIGKHEPASQLEAT